MQQRLIIALYLLLSSVYSFASIEIRSRQITIADGLANNSVRCFMQDSKGFIWMGTLNGLNRYDGNSFISYYPSFDNSLSLSERKVYDIKEDKNGFLWLYFSSERFSCYDLKKACFVDYTGCNEFLQKYSARTFASNGDVWLSNDVNGARRIIYENNSFRSVPYKWDLGNLPSNKVNFVAEGKNGTIWLGTESGLVRVIEDENVFVDEKEDFYQMALFEGNCYFLTREGKVFVYDETSSQLKLKDQPDQRLGKITGHFVLKDDWVILTTEGVFTYNFLSNQLQPRSDFFGENILSAMTVKDNKNNVWVSNHTGRVWYINTQTRKQKVFNLIPVEKMGYIDSERYQVVHDSRDIIWISTYGNGLFAYDLQKDELTHFKAGMDGFSHITSDYMLGVMEDRSGEIWISAEFSGISRISVINEGSYRYLPENPNLLDRSNTIRMVSVIDDNIWIGTRKGGIYVYDSNFNLQSSRKDFHSNIYAVVKDHEGKIWMGSRGDGLCIDDVWYKNNSYDPHSLSNNNIFCIHKDSKNRTWVGTFGGGLDLAEKTGNSYRFHHFFNNSYSQKQTRTICEDKNGKIWIGTSNGIYVFDPDSIINNPEKYYHYTYFKGDLTSNEIKYIFSDSKGNMWIATSGYGFSICTPGEDYNKQTFEHYGTKDGLCNDVVQSIAEDKQGNIWLSTEYGLSKFVRSQKTFENYFFSAYSQGNVFTETAVCQCQNGDILFGTNYGFIVFNPAKVKKPSLSFPVVFTNLNINGVNMLPGDQDSPLTRSLAYSNELKLTYQQNSFTIDFSSFNYADAGQTKYSYILSGYDKNWSAPSTVNFASYKMLPHGTYELQVKSCNSSGVWNDTISTLKVIVAPPFYLTIWAFLVYALLLTTALFFTYRITRNFNRLHNKIQIEKQLTDYKLVFFTNISHEFRTPLTLIQGALERIRRMNISHKEMAYPLQTMEKSTKRLLRLIDQLLEFRKMQNNKLALSLEKTDVVAMLYEIFLSFEDMAESKNMDFQFVPSTTSYKMYVDKEKLDKITYNLLSNAFKYTPQGGKIRLHINVDSEHDLLEIQVSDTGVGIPKEKRSELFKRFMQSNFSGESVGIGLHLTHELVTVHKGNISYSENTEGGSIFTVTLPLNINVYEDNDFLIPNNVLMQKKQESIVQEHFGEIDKPEDLPARPNPLNKQKVLVIEDDIDVRQYLKEELSAYFEVEVAEDGTTGFQLAQETAPDLIVCDVMMPGMNGYDVTRKLKAEFNTSHIPVILLTALSLPENHLEGIESGADAYLSKPFSIRLLLTRIIKLLEQREKLKEKFSEEPGIVRTAIYASDRDKEFVDQLHSILTANLGNSSFSVDEFASLVSLGRTVFYKKVKGVTGYSPNEYLRIMRMKKAAELLREGHLTVSEVSYKVGIDDPFYFSKCFKAQFGVAPSVFQKGK